MFIIDWWNSLSLVSQVFACVAIPATMILLIQTLLLFFGVGEDADGVDDIPDDVPEADIGDGTFGEVVNGAVGVSGVSVGVVPIGTGNDFVRNFSSGELFFDIDAQIDGQEERIDILKCNDKYAVNMINIGFDCEVVKKKEVFNKKPFMPSKLAYIF